MLAAAGLVLVYSKLAAFKKVECPIACPPFFAFFDPLRQSVSVKLVAEYLDFSLGEPVRKFDFRATAPKLGDFLFGYASAGEIHEF